MSKEYIVEGVSQTNPYVVGASTRKLKIYFSIPDEGVNQKTGIILLIPGYGGNANSNVYKKMRRIFPDKYNLISVQCDYMGWEFMQSFEQNQALELLQKSGIALNFQSLGGGYIQIKLPIPLEENLNNFNDMGPVQVMDLLNCLKFVSNKFSDKFNRRKIIAYGHSHGAYLAHLCNVFMPKMFSAIIDISGMTFPVYLEPSRMFTHNFSIGSENSKLLLSIQCQFSYLNSKILLDPEIYNLNLWYGIRNNTAKILAFQGATDSMVLTYEKLNFLRDISNSKCIVVDGNLVDNRIFKSTGHGCGADYLELFDNIMNNYDLTSSEESCVFEEQMFETKKFKYRIINSDDLLRLYVL